MKLWIRALLLILVLYLLADASPIPGDSTDHSIDKRSAGSFNFGFLRFRPQHIPSRRFDRVRNYFNEKYPDYEKFPNKRSLDDDYSEE